jgi:hypothetical protein
VGSPHSSRESRRNPELGGQLGGPQQQTGLEENPCLMRLPVGRVIAGLEHISPSQNSGSSTESPNVAQKGAYFCPLSLPNREHPQMVRNVLETSVNMYGKKIMFLGSKLRRVRRADNLNAICEPIV